MRLDEISERLLAIAPQTSSSQLALAQPLAVMLGPQLVGISAAEDGTVVLTLSGGNEVWVL